MKIPISKSDFMVFNSRSKSIEKDRFNTCLILSERQFSDSYMIDSSGSDNTKFFRSLRVSKGQVLVSRCGLQ
ncbi:hypothetical protein MKW98_000819 [Papaver atlanticum]|uniref:Uncharacterized protein n=1 Tax=Papaver atlanticum TaxID=357466 RepID=A0AAD4SCN4_9MAGN|nr:hypothetical protein MKW98_000819 [Papaver atlanticum]